MTTLAVLAGTVDLGEGTRLFFLVKIVWAWKAMIDLSALSSEIVPEPYKWNVIYKFHL